jgi:hypothetical protein
VKAEGSQTEKKDIAIRIPTDLGTPRAEMRMEAAG